MPRCLLPLLLLACGPTQATSPTGHESAAARDETETAESTATPPEDEGAGSDEQRAEPTDGLSVRLVLDHPTMPANAQPATDERARLDATLFLRNDRPTPETVETVIPAAFECEWRLTAADGSVWRPTFLPPPMPRPGGRPRVTVRVPAHGEAEVAPLHGISGFTAEGDPAAERRPLPEGTYQVVVSEIRLGDRTYVAPPVTLTVR